MKIGDKIFDINTIMGWRPCYDRLKIAKLFGNKNEVTLFELLYTEKCSAKDKLWVALRNHFFNNSDLRLMAAAFAENVLRIFEKKYSEDLRPRKAIMAARLFALGEIDDAANAAQDAANAAWAAAEDAAWAAAWAAVGDAANAAWTAASAAEDAAWDAANAAGDVAWVATWAAALEIVKIYAKQNNYNRGD